MDQVFQFAGKFHPLLVHLPIGFLLIAVIFIWVKEHGKAVKISIGLGALAAIFSVITGLLLAESTGYADEVNAHKWSGIVLMIVSVAMWFVPEQFLKIGSVVMTVLIFLTGHFGGTLTHGPLIEEPEAENLDLTKIDLDNAVFYSDAVQPILEARCYSCHGDDKQKGGLRLNDPDAITKGGKNGKIIVPGNPEESDIVKRLDLPLEDEDHMPPKERKQLTDQEKKLISLWVASGSDFDKKISEALDAKQLASLTEASNEIQLPKVDVPEPDEKLIEKLTELNVAITPVAQESNFLQVSFISLPGEKGDLLAQLKPLAKNIVWLNLKGTQLGDFAVSDFSNLTELNLSGTKISDAVIDEIVKCKSLVKLNLSNTNVSSVDKLKDLTNLRYLNIYNTKVTSVDLPNVLVEKGDYEVPTFQTDTTFVKE